MTLVRHGIVVVLLAALAGLPAVAAEGTLAAGPHELQLGTMKTISGNELRIYEGQSAGGDLYAAVRRARVGGTVEGDLLVMSTDVGISGTVERDLDVMTSKLDLSGKVGSRMRVLALEARVSGEVGADAVVFAATTTFEPSSVVRGSLAINATNVELSGLVDGPAWIGAGKVEINGRISGDTTVSCDELTLGPAAKIEGNLTYRSRTAVDVPRGVVAGVVTRTETPPDEPSSIKETTDWFGLSRKRTLFDLYLALTALVAGSLMTLFLRPTVSGALQRAATGEQLAVSFGIGLVATLALLVIGVACCALFPLSLAVLSGLAALGYFGGLVGKMIAGAWALNALGKRATHPLVALVIGVTLVFLVNLVPVIGALIWFLVTITGMGATLLQVREGRDNRTPSAPTAIGPTAQPAPFV